jgi:UDP-2,3-diacylglucosamine pyrophosphatase LpxH
MDAAPHTLVFSDLHLTTAERPDPARPLWKRWQQRDLFVDDAIAAMLRQAREEARGGPLEVVLDGDVFDFDAVTGLPAQEDYGVGGPFPIGWLERERGLHPSEPKSAWKMARILDDHPVFVEALRQLLTAGHRVVFVIGNHDIELHWPAVQAVLRARLQPDGRGDLRICAFFYVSHGDTLIEHGNQYDAYCLCLDPISPLVRVPPLAETRVRLPFGNYASRYMINGMGMFNPHAGQSFILSFWGYVLFFWQHVARVQPLLPITWFWTACVTFVASLRDGLLPAERDVLSLEERVDAIAREANSTPRVVRALDALKVHTAIFRPWMVARELWLDRVLLFLLVVFGSFELLATAKVFVGIPTTWGWLGLMFLMFPPFLLYARGVSSDVNQTEAELVRRLPLIARLTGCRRVVIGHTHAERHVVIEGVELLNAGTWSPAFRDVACTEPYGRKCVVRLRPRSDGTRVASLEAWDGHGFVALEPGEEPAPSLLDQLSATADALLEPEAPAREVASR